MYLGDLIGDMVGVSELVWSMTNTIISSKPQWHGGAEEESRYFGSILLYYGYTGDGSEQETEE